MITVLPGFNVFSICKVYLELPSLCSFLNGNCDFCFIHTFQPASAAVRLAVGCHRRGLYLTDLHGVRTALINAQPFGSFKRSGGVPGIGTSGSSLSFAELLILFRRPFVYG